jgi:hypothetical protein
MQCVLIYYLPSFFFFSHLHVVHSDRPTITVIFSFSICIYIHLCIYEYICMHIYICFLGIASTFEGKHAHLVFLNGWNSCLHLNIIRLYSVNIHSNEEKAKAVQLGWVFPQVLTDVTATELWPWPLRLLPLPSFFIHTSCKFY